MPLPTREAFSPFTGSYTRFDRGFDHDGSDVVVYDNETAGLDTEHGQIYQFGCIHADRNLNERASHDIRVRRLPYVVPTPGALRVTGLDARRIDRPDALTEYEATGRISAILSFPPMVTNRLFLTYNGMGFDDRLLSVTLNRNLRDPGFYLRPREQDKVWRKGNSTLRVMRIDMMNVMRLACAMAPDRIRFTQKEDGKPDLRLESVAAANGIVIRAHDAVEDCRATLLLARLVRDRAPEVWSVAKRAACTRKIRERLSNAERDGSLLWVYRRFEHSDVMPCVVLRLDQGKVLLADLRRLDEGLPPEAGADGVAGIAFCKDPMVSSAKIDQHPYFLTREEAEALAPDFVVPWAESIHGKYLEGRYDARLAEYRRRIDAQPGYRPSQGQSAEKSTCEWKTCHERDRVLRERFTASDDWVERATIEFGNREMGEFAARLVAMHCDLDALVEQIGKARVEEIRRLAAPAFARPFAGPDAPWTTVSSACSDEAADDAFREWVARAYPVDGREPVAEPEPEEAQGSLFRI